MKRIPFRAEEFISNEKTPVETFSNDSIVKVEITTTAGSMMERYPVEGLATFRNGRVHDFTWTETGVHDIEDPEYTDLNLCFSATPDEAPRVGVAEKDRSQNQTLEELVDAAYNKIDPQLLEALADKLKEAQALWRDDTSKGLPENIKAPSEIPAVIEKSIAISVAVTLRYLANLAVESARKGGAK